MTTLITGACGAIGSVVVNVLKDRYPDRRFVVIDALTYAGRKEHIQPPFDNYAFYYGNICDSSFVTYVLNAEEPKYIIHLAAETHVDQSFGNSFKFTETNVFGTHVLLECARKYGKLECFLHMSTDEVYGSVEDGETCSDTTLIAPSNPYSASKAAAEMMCHAYWKSFKIPIVIIRCNNAISPYQHEEKLIPRTIACIRNGQRVPVHGKGEAKRTFIHAKDITNALDIIMQHTLETHAYGKIYNIGSTFEYSVMDVIRIILKKMKGANANLEDWVEYVPDRPFQDYRYSVDATELQNLGWKEEVAFEQAIDELLKE